MNSNQKKLTIYLCDPTYDTIILVSDTIPINIGFIGSYMKKIFGNQKINKLLKSTNPLLQKQSSSKQIKIDTMSDSKDKKKVKEIFREVTKGLQEIKNILKK